MVSDSMELFGTREILGCFGDGGVFVDDDSPMLGMVNVVAPSSCCGFDLLFREFLKSAQPLPIDESALVPVSYLSRPKLLLMDDEVMESLTGDGCCCLLPVQVVPLDIPKIDSSRVDDSSLLSCCRDFNCSLRARACSAKYFSVTLPENMDDVIVARVLLQLLSKSSVLVLVGKIHWPTPCFLASAVDFAYRRGCALKYSLRTPRGNSRYRTHIISEPSKKILYLHACRPRTDVALTLLLRLLLLTVAAAAAAEPSCAAEIQSEMLATGINLMIVGLNISESCATSESRRGRFLRWICVVPTTAVILMVASVVFLVFI